MDHTAELELEVQAPTEQAVFVEATAALGELLAEDPDDARDAPPARREVSAQASDRPALLAAWLEELVFLAETEGLQPGAWKAYDLAPT